MTPLRVLSLLPASTEIICALGAAECLVGVSHECDFPNDVVRELPRVTRSNMSASASAPGSVDAEVRAMSSIGQPLYTLDETMIEQLAPDVILTQALCDVCAVSETDVRVVAARLPQQPEVVTLSGSTWAGVVGDMVTIGNAIRRKDIAAAFIASLEARLSAIHDTLKDARASRPRVAVIEWTDPIYIAGHWVPELVRRAGGLDVMAAPGEHSTIHSADVVRDSAPEILIIAPCGYDVDGASSAARTLLQEGDWHWAEHIPVWAIDANALMSRPGPRLVNGVETLAAILHPRLFPAPDQARAMRVL